MFTPEQVAADPPGWPATLAGSGVLDLDQVTSGIRERSVWVVSGPPRAGRSMLGVQLARNLAAAGVPVRIVLGRDGAAEVVARFRAGSLGRSLSECRREPPAPDEPWLGWPLEFDPDRSRYEEGAWTAMPATGALFVDDLDLWPDAVLDFGPVARRWVDHPGRVVIVTVPSHVLRPDDPPTWQAWVRLADVIVEIGRDSDGAAPLRVLSHRHGPVATCHVAVDFERASLSSLDL